MLFALLLAEAAEGEEEAINPVIPEINEMFWGIIAFAALYVLVTYVLLPPIQRIRNDRAATIQADIDAADAARAQAVSASAEMADQLADVRAEAAAIIDAARAEADAERERLVARAEREVNAMREIAESEITAEREQALASLRPQVAELAVSAASRVTGRSIDGGSAQSVVDRYLTNPS